MRRLAALLATATVVAACGDSFSPSGVAGSYSLTSADGTSIPATFDLGAGVSLTFNSATLTLRDDETWLLSINVTLADATTTVTETDTGSGTFTLTEPSTIRLTDSDGDVVSGTIDGSRITLIDDGVSLVFEK